MLRRAGDSRLQLTVKGGGLVPAAALLTAPGWFGDFFPPPLLIMVTGHAECQAAGWSPPRPREHPAWQLWTLARPPAKAFSPCPAGTGDTASWCWWPWGHPCSPAVLRASRSGADVPGRLWDVKSLARPLKYHVLPLSAALLARVMPAVAAVMLWYFSFLLLIVTRRERLNRFE